MYQTIAYGELEAKQTVYVK